MVADNPNLAPWMGWPQVGEVWPDPFGYWLDTEYPVGRGARNSGWQCPGCGACYSPSVAACFNCRGTRVTTGTDANEPEPSSGTRLGPDDPMTDDDYER